MANIVELNDSSTSLSALWYHRKALVVRFKNGSVYSYANVPRKKYEDMLKAESRGSFFSREIRSKFQYFKLSE